MSLVIAVCVDSETLFSNSFTRENASKMEIPVLMEWLVSQMGLESRNELAEIYIVENDRVVRFYGEELWEFHEEM